MYEVFEKKATRSGFPAVSITPAGKLDLNAAAVRKFREAAAENVLLLWDKTHRKIAIRVISKRDTRSFKVSYFRNLGGSHFWCLILEVHRLERHETSHVSSRLE